MKNDRARRETAAGIVLYHPDIRRLRENIEAIYPQVQTLILVDNDSENREEIQSLAENYEGITCIWNRENRGVAKALNQLVEEAVRQGFHWILTLDDDSVCEGNMIREYSRFFTCRRVGIICPQASDDKMEGRERRLSKKAEWTASCITAGSLINAEVWEKVGGFDEKMFIDFVDVEYCTRLRAAGYGILRVNTTKVHQQFGNIDGRIRFLGMTLYRFNYSPTRIYYSVRNQIYYMKKHRKVIRLGRQVCFLVGYIGKRLIFEKNRRGSLVAIGKGVRDGIRMSAE